MHSPNSSKMVNVNGLTPKKPMSIKAGGPKAIWKEDVIKWLQGLTQLQRWSVMTVRDERMLGLLQAMINKDRANFRHMGFGLSVDLITGKQSIFSRDSYRNKNNKVYTPDQIKASQTEILNDIIIFKQTEEITLRKSLINNPQSLLHHISVMTSDLVFSFVSSEDTPIRSSVWFKQKDFHSVCEWFVHAFENEIIANYIKNIQVVVYDRLETLLNKHCFLYPTIKSQYFTLQACNQYYKDKRIPDTEQGRKNRQLNIHKILELVADKSKEDVVNDVLFQRLFTSGDKSYAIYLQIVSKLADQAYQEHQLEELFRMTNPETKPKSKNTNKNKRKRNKKIKQLSNQKEELTATGIQPQQQEAPYQQATDQDIQIAVDNPSYSSTSGTEKPNQTSSPQQYQQEDKEVTVEKSEEMGTPENVQPKRKKPKVKKGVSTFISNCLKQYIDDLSESSNKLLNYRKMVYNRMDSAIRKVFLREMVCPLWDLRVFGSCALGLCTQSSDIDMVIIIQTPEDMCTKILQTLHEHFESQKWAISSKMILSSVPLIKLEVDLAVEHPVEGKEYNLVPGNKSTKNVPVFQVDLSVETLGSQNHQGLKTTLFAEELLKKYDNLRQITMLLKVFLKSKNLHLTFLGGINSYVLFLMVYAFLKERRLLQDKQVFQPLQQLLLFYSQQFDYESTIIDVRLDKPMTNTMPVLQKLTIVDPLSQKQRYINTNSSQLDKILDLFREIRFALSDFKQSVQSCKGLDLKCNVKKLGNEFKKLMNKIAQQGQ